MRDNNIPNVLVQERDPLPDENGLCDSVWACILNDYMDEEYAAFYSEDKKEKSRGSRSKDRSKSRTRKEKRDKEKSEKETRDKMKKKTKNRVQENRDTGKSDEETSEDEPSKQNLEREEPPEQETINAEDFSPSNEKNEYSEQPKIQEGAAEETLQQDTVADADVPPKREAFETPKNRHVETESPPIIRAPSRRVELPSAPSGAGPGLLAGTSTNPFDDDVPGAAPDVPGAAPDAPGSSTNPFDTVSKEAKKKTMSRNAKKNVAKPEKSQRQVTTPNTSPDEDTPSSHFRSIEDYQKSVLESRRRAERKLALKRIREIKAKLAAKADP